VIPVNDKVFAGANRAAGEIRFDLLAPGTPAVCRRAVRYAPGAPGA
jgi:hypothetical protein